MGRSPSFSLVAAFALVLGYPLCCCGEETQPGIEAFLRQPLLDEITSKFLPIGLNFVKDEVHVEALSGETTGVKWALKNIAITSLQPMDGSTLGFSGHDIDVKVVMEGQLDMDFAVDTFILAESGKAVVKFSDSKISSKLLTGKSDDGSPTVTLGDVAVDLNKLDIDLKGGGFKKWLLNFVVTLITGTLKGEVEKEFRKLLPKEINKALLELLKKYPLSLPIADKLSISTKMLQPPVSVDAHTSFQLQVDGEASVIEGSKQSPFAASPSFGVPQGSSMVEVSIDRSVALSALWAVVESNLVDVRVGQKNLPKDIPFQLNTDWLQFLLPETHKFFPGRNVSVEVSLVQTPNMEFHQQEITASIFAKLAMFVDDNDKGDDTKVMSITMGLDVAADVHYSSPERRVSAVVHRIVPSVTDSECPYDEVDTTMITKVLEFASKTVLMPAAMEYGQKGYIIPTFPVVDIVDPVIQLMEPEKVYLQTNIDFRPLADSLWERLAPENHVQMDEAWPKEWLEREKSCCLPPGPEREEMERIYEETFVDVTSVVDEDISRRV